MKIIITGATGMVGEGVLLECLRNESITTVLTISRKSYGLKHPKLKELLVADFTKLNEYAADITGYDACFYCAGVSSVGMKEDKYTYITYTTTLAFAASVLAFNPAMKFIFVSGQSTDSSQSGRLMWARVKGKTENDLMKMPFAAVYNFRPGVMMPVDGQKNWKKAYLYIAKVMRFLSPKSILSLGEVAKAMIKAASEGAPKQVLEVKDIKALAR